MSGRSAELFHRAQQVLSGGVSRNTLLRDPHPLYAKEASGCRITDVDGVERIDFANNMASLIHGHGHPAVIEAVTAQLGRGTAYTMATEVEVEFAEHLCGRSDAFDKVRFMNSGTEAVMAGLKAARAFTGRPRIAKVEGTYHGGYDYAEISQAPPPAEWGEKHRPASVALAMGTPESISRDVTVLPFNDPESAIAILDDHRDEIACVLVDPVPHRVGMVPANEPFIQALRSWTHDNDALLLFDEVITFRIEVGGMQQRFGVRPDLTAMGKIIGGGFPVGALAGCDEVMAVFTTGESGPRLPHSGTFSANPITMTAGLAAMSLYDAAAVARLNRLGRLARSRIEEAISLSGAAATVTGAGSVFRIHLNAVAPTDYRSSLPTLEAKQALNRFIDELFAAGIFVIHTAAGVLSTPMGEAEIDQLAEAVLSGMRTVKELL